MNKLIKISVSILITLVITILIIMKLDPWKSPEAWVEDFYSLSNSEPKIVDPLLLGGKKVLPLISESIKNKEMKRRRYAIAFLGYSGEKESILLLKDIFKDNSEKDYFRGDALEAIYLIDSEQGKELAKNYSGDEEYVAMIASEIISSRGNSIEKRTLIDAIIGW